MKRQEISLLFVHGWAFGPEFWNELRKRLQGANQFVVNRGYFNTPDFARPSLEELLARMDGPWFGVGHSLGFAQLAGSDLTLCKGLISISGFFNFCSDRTTPPKVVQRMSRAFDRDPHGVLSDFYQKCGCSEAARFEPNLPALSRDLSSLGRTKFELAEPIESWKGVPVLALAGKNDKIFGASLTQTQFAAPTFHPVAGHDLGFNHPDWCAERIDCFTRRS